MEVLYLRRVRDSILIFICILTMSSFKLSAQVLEESDCPLPVETFNSKFAMELFLTDVNYKDKRVASGTDNIPLSEVMPVSDEAICRSLQSIVNANPRYKDEPNSKLRKYFYKTSNFYFVFWGYKNLNAFGGKKLFLVIKKDYSNIYEFYL